jgi:hypothetical protein
VAAYVILNYGTFSRTRYHMSALLNADITMDDGPYSIMLTHHYSVRHLFGHLDQPPRCSDFRRTPADLASFSLCRSLEGRLKRRGSKPLRKASAISASRMIMR